jgi:hypothetical protein
MQAGEGRLRAKGKKLEGYGRIESAAVAPRNPVRRQP